MERIRFSFARKKPLAYISHLDIMRLFLRALRRSALPVAYSQGYNPHPRLTLALPLPLGVTAAEELGEIVFAEVVGPEKFINILSLQLPGALELLHAVSADPEQPALAAKVCAARYRVYFSRGSDVTGNEKLLEQALEYLMAKEEIILEKKSKKKKTININVRPYIYEAVIIKKEDKPLELRLLLKAGSSGGVSPFFVIEQLTSVIGSALFNDHDWHVHREKLYADHNGTLQPLSERM